MAQQTKPRVNIGLLIGFMVAAVFIAVTYMLTKDVDLALLNPKGTIADEQTRLLIITTLLMLGFGVPIILTLYFFIWKYRDNGDENRPTPAPTVSNKFLLFSWGGPLVIVAIIAALLIPATYRLVPQNSIESDKDQLTIQVVALNWKWLFIYPEQNIATVNFAQIPVDTPVRFELTADESPMGSFWIPHLAGMLYTMTGHVNPLNMVAHTNGDYEGGAAEINGTGFAGMRFTTRVSSEKDFNTWVEQTKQSPLALDDATYNELLKPSENNPPTFYSSSNPTLFSSIVNKYNSGHEHDAAEDNNGSH